MSRSPVTISLGEMCRALGVDVPAGLRADTALTGISTLEEAGPQQAAFLARGKYRAKATESRAAVILAPDNIKIDDARLLAVPAIWPAVLRLMELFHPAPAPEDFVHPTAVIAPGARIGRQVWIGPHAVVSDGAAVGDRTRIGAHAFLGQDVRVGADCLLHPNTTVMHECVLGDRVILHPGAVIGADGFRYEMIERSLRKIPQIGNVVIEDDVEVGANSTIDRAGFSSTRISARTKIDNQVHIAHNCVIGPDCIIVGQAGIAGSTTLGRGVILGGQAGVRDNSNLGDGVHLAARATAHGNIAPGTEMHWHPPMEAREFRRLMRAMLRLPDVLERLRPLLKDLPEDDAPGDEE